jgi:phosphoserine phosphatase
MQYKLIFFDLLGSLVDSSDHIWNIIHDYLGIDKEVRLKALNDFKEGKLTYQEWVAHNVNLWADKGVTKDILLQAIDGLTIREGALEVLQKLKNNHFRLVLMSGGLNFVFEKIFKQHQMLFDHIFINKLTFGNGNVIAGGTATPFDMRLKAVGLRIIAQKEGVSLEKCVFIGNNKDDVEAAQIAGLSIAFNSRSQELSDASNVQINSSNLMDILPYVMKE